MKENVDILQIYKGTFVKKAAKTTQKFSPNVELKSIQVNLTTLEM